MRLFHLSMLAPVLAAAAFQAGPGYAEVFVLRSGGAVEGEFVNRDRSAGDPYRVRTESGLELALADAVVHRVVIKSNLEKEYEARLPNLANTVEARWELAEWCKEVGLLEQRKQQLQAIVGLDPDHVPSRKALGYQQVNGQWLTSDENMQRQGYVRYKGAWRLKQEIEIESRERQNELAAKQWRKNIRMWFEQIASGSRHAETAFKELSAIDDPGAATALVEILADSSQPSAIRRRCLDILGKLPPGLGLPALINLAMNDADGELRDRCLDEIKRAGSHVALPRFIAELKSKDNLRVNRAGECLARLGDKEATLSLIDALVTEHKYQVSSSTPGQMSQSFGGQTSGPAGNSGGGGGLGGFSFGGKPQIIKKLHENAGVLAALNTFYPDAGLQYNVDAWKKWYSQRQTGTLVDLRRDP